MRRQQYGALFFLLFLLTSAACSSAEAGQRQQNEKSPLGYEWTIDTLDYAPLGRSHGQTGLVDIWGANDSLIFAVGFNTFDGLGAMWKYDGRGWERVRLLTSEGGPVPRAFGLTTIKGYSDHDIYAFGYFFSSHRVGSFTTALALHYNGVRWNLIDSPGSARITSALLTPSAVYCGGTNRQLFKYDGERWSVDLIASISHNPLPLALKPVGMAGKDSIYCAASQHDPVRNLTYPQFGIVHNHLLNALDDSLEDCAWPSSAYWQSGNGTLYSCGAGGIYRLTDKKWTNIYPADKVTALYGTSEKRIFAADNTAVYHYDGERWMPVYIVPPGYRIIHTHIWCNDHEVFILMGDMFKTYIVHGK